MFWFKALWGQLGLQAQVHLDDITIPFTECPRVHVFPVTSQDNRATQLLHPVNSATHLSSQGNYQKVTHKRGRIKGIFHCEIVKVDTNWKVLKMQTDVTEVSCLGSESWRPAAACKLPEPHTPLPCPFYLLNSIQTKIIYYSSSLSSFRIKSEGGKSQEEGRKSEGLLLGTSQFLLGIIQ